MQKQHGMKTALKWAFVMSWGPSAIASLLTFVLAMYLGPHDYGLVAIAGLYISFNKIFLEGGLGAAIVQRKQLDPEHLDAAFWITLLQSLFLMALTWVVAPYWADANQDAEQVKIILFVASFVMPIQGLTVVQESLLEKQMDFKSLAIRSNVSALVGGIFGFWLATQRYGCWALVGEDLLSAAVRLVLLWRLADWRPRFTFSWKHLVDLWGFSIYIMLGQIGTFVQRRSDAMLIGLFFGPTAVGIYRLADRIISMIIEMATRPFVMVVLPRFSHLQDNVAELRKSVKQSLRASAMLTIPLLAILAGMAYHICATLSSRGQNWRDATYVIQVLALVGAARAATLFAGPLVQSINRPRLFMSMSWGLAILNTVAFCITGWIVTKDSGLLARFGIHIDVTTEALAVAIARAIVFCLIYTPLCLWIMARICKVSVAEMFGSMTVANITAAVVYAVGIGCDLLLRHIPAPSFWLKFMRLSIGGTIVTALALYLMFRLEPGVRDFVLRKLGKKKGRGGDNGSANGSGGSGGSTHGRVIAVEPVVPAPEGARLAVDQ
jgi:PST family polysaccharide transporter